MLVSANLIIYIKMIQSRKMFSFLFKIDMSKIVQSGSKPKSWEENEEEGRNTGKIFPRYFSNPLQKSERKFIHPWTKKQMEAPPR